MGSPVITDREKTRKVEKKTHGVQTPRSQVKERYSDQLCQIFLRGWLKFKLNKRFGNMELMILRADKDSFSGESLWEERSWEYEPPCPPKIGHATDYREGDGVNHACPIVKERLL